MRSSVNFKTLLVTALFATSVHAIGGAPPPRPAPTPLFSVKGPGCDDIKQTETPNCWFAATMCALARVSPDYVKSLFSVADKYKPGQALDKTSVKIWSSDGTLNNVDVSEDDATAEKDGESTGANLKSAWWPAGLETGAIRKGFSQPQTKFFASDGPQDPGYALHMLTGKEGVRLRVENLGSPQPEYWEAMQRSDKTPIILCTGHQFNRGDLPLVVGHAYTVIQTGMEDGRQRVQLFNPWGEYKWYYLGDLIFMIDGIYHIKDFPTL